MEQYHGKSDQYHNCYEPCLIKSPMIGSIACSECGNCVKHGTDDFDGSVTWIMCKKLDEALGRDVDEM